MKHFKWLFIVFLTMPTMAMAQNICLKGEVAPSIVIFDLNNLRVNLNQVVSITSAQYAASADTRNYVSKGFLVIVNCVLMSPTPTPTITFTPTITLTPTNTPTGTITPVNTPTKTPTPANTNTFTPTFTPTATPPTWDFTGVSEDATPVILIVGDSNFYEDVHASVTNSTPNAALIQIYDGPNLAYSHTIAGNSNGEAIPYTLFQMYKGYDWTLVNPTGAPGIEISGRYSKATTCCTK